MKWSKKWGRKNDWKWLCLIVFLKCLTKYESFTLKASDQSKANNPHVAIGERWSICCDNWYNYWRIHMKKHFTANFIIVKIREKYKFTEKVTSVSVHELMTLCTRRANFLPLWKKLCEENIFLANFGIEILTSPAIKPPV